MADYMKEDFRAIYDNPDVTRRAIITRGRKNAKTTECAMIVLLHLVGPEARANSQLFSAAQSRDQASILFSLAAKMVRMAPELQPFVIVRDTAKQLECKELGTLYRALSADATTAYGLSPALTIHDELGQVKGPKSELYEALETATAAQEEPLSIIISTQAPTDADLLSTLIDDAQAGEDKRIVLRMNYAPASIADPFSDEAIRAANPAFDLFMNRDEVRGMAAKARRMPSAQPEFENLILNRRVEMSSPFISQSLWMSCAAAPAPFGNMPVYGGLDLSEVNDLTALLLGASIDGVWNVRPTFWLPAEGLAERSRQDRVPYDQWAREGFIETVPGKSIDYQFVAAYLWRQFQTLNIQKIGFDRWNWRHFKPWLLAAGFTEAQLETHFVEVGQGFQTQSPALRDMESAILNGKLAHGAHPVLTMCAANAVVQTDPAGNRKLTKARSRGRIDGLVAMADMFASAPAAADAKPPPSYQIMFV